MTFVIATAFASRAHAAPNDPRLVAISLDGGCVVTSGDVVRCFGEVLTHMGGDEPSATFSIRDTPRGIVDIVLGDMFGCVRTSSGEVFCFGAGGIPEAEIEAEVTEREAACEEGPESRIERCYDAVNRWSDAIPETAWRVATNAADVAVRTEMRCIVWTNGSVACEMADGSEARDAAALSMSMPRRIPSFGRAVAIDVGDAHVCAVAATGGVYCWGDLDRRALETRPAVRTNEPARVRGIEDAVDVAIGAAETCILRRSGEVTCFTHDDDGAPALTRFAEGARSLTNVARLALRDRVACVVTTDRRTLCWGDNDNGELGVGDTTDRETPTLVPAYASATAIAVDSMHSCAIVGRALRCAGSAASGFFEADPMPSRHVFTPLRDTAGNDALGTRVDADPYRSCLRLRDGTWMCTDIPGGATVELVREPTGRTDIAALRQSCTLSSEATLECEHRGRRANVAAFRTERGTICALERGGDLWCAFGNTPSPAPDPFVRVVRDGPVVDFVINLIGICTLSREGRVRCTNDRGVDTTPPAFASGGFVELAGMADGGPCARTRTGTVVCGGSRSPETLPRLARGAPAITEFEVTSSGYCALDAARRLTCAFGPYVARLDDVVQFTMALTHAVALRRDGRVFAWGPGPGEHATGPARRIRATPVPIRLGR